MEQLHAAPVGSFAARCVCAPAAAAAAWTKSGSYLVLMATAAFLCWETSHVCLISKPGSFPVQIAVQWISLHQNTERFLEYLHKITHKIQTYTNAVFTICKRTRKETVPEMAAAFLKMNTLFTLNTSLVWSLMSSLSLSLFFFLCHRVDQFVSLILHVYLRRPSQCWIGVNTRWPLLDWFVMFI